MIERAMGMLRFIIGSLAEKFRYLQESDQLSDDEKKKLRGLTEVQDGVYTMTYDMIVNSLYTLSEMLCKHHKQKVIILIDEYDVPLDKAYQFGYYDEMVGLIRNMFNQALKSNDNMYFSVLTGCLRVSKESIFTGLNNPQVFTITDVRFNEWFGFTDTEVKELLAFYGLSDAYSEVRDWYDGYKFGNTDVYCPWDVINYAAELRANPKTQPKDYWTNNSGNDIIRRFIQKARKSTTKREIEQLIAGETIKKEIHQEMTYKDIDQSIDNLWSILFMAGYLTQAELPDGDMYTLRIPNLEIRKIFTRQIYAWFKETAWQDGEALAQIETLDYEELLRSNGIEKILKYGIACNRKHCRVKMR